VVDGGATIQNLYGATNVMTVTAGDSAQFSAIILQLISKRSASLQGTAKQYLVEVVSRDGHLLPAGFFQAFHICVLLSGPRVQFGE
jgi:hypothetical protein